MSLPLRYPYPPMEATSADALPDGKDWQYDELLLRVHPLESRVRMLAEAHPARLQVFDLLVDERGRSLVGLPLSERGPRLVAFAR